ncbi:MAG: tyrosine-type recombinase/integrase, partial [Lactococcus garvieae]
QRQPLIAADLGAPLAISVDSFLDKYMAIQTEKLENGQIKYNTLRQKNLPVRLMRQMLGTKEMPSVDVLDINLLINTAKDQGKNTQASIIRKVCIDIFKEAQACGDVPVGYNPAESTREPYVKVQRSRLSLEEFVVIYEQSKKLARKPWVPHVIMLALLTAQREGDLIKIKMSDIDDRHLFVEQQKTGAKIAIPLDIRLDAVDMSLRELLAIIEQESTSPYEYLIHSADGSAIKDPGTVSKAFARARDKCTLDWENKQPASFHEIRSLAQRLYAEQGINTQKLLGHKNAAMTVKYGDARGKSYTFVEL